jgi:2-polyprenyl-3-methyl-5-hydroxy-6-metoxy-1,4-benzoquinol methylase
VRLDPAIRTFYETEPEEDRLAGGLPALEWLRTRSLIQRHAPTAPATVLDVGGAAGAYSAWLAELGYTVHLVDPIPRLVAEAQRRSASHGARIATCAVADARGLPFQAESADVVLLLGPLYHLVDAAERFLTLKEAARVLRPNGVLFAAAITRWAYALYGLTKDQLFSDTQFQDVVASTVREGRHRGGTGYFTSAYFHRPEELRAEVLNAGFALTGCYGIEGPCGLLGDFEARWSDPPRRSIMIRIAEVVESEPSLLGASPHLLAVARKSPRGHDEAG